jgi:DNA-binding transcriptional LysR family regulator
MKRQVAETETCITDLVDLRAFCLVVDLGSITAAAKALGETKGTVSRRLTRLERALGVVLVRRSPRLVQATEDGVAYRMRVGQALEVLDDANRSLQQAQATPSGHLRVTTPLDLGISIVAPLVAGFIERFPEVSVEMLLSDAVLDFDAHQIDVALRASRSLGDSSLIAYKLRQLDLGLFAAPAYLKKRRPPRKPDELATHRLLMFRATRGHATLTLRASDETESLRLRVRAAISASEYSFAREAALAGAGIALLPTVVAKRDLEDGSLVAVLKNYTVQAGGTFYLLHQGTHFLAPKVRVFRDYILDAFSVRGRPQRPALAEEVSAK